MIRLLMLGVGGRGGPGRSPVSSWQEDDKEKGTPSSCQDSKEGKCWGFPLLPFFIQHMIRLEGVSCANSVCPGGDGFLTW